MNADFGSFAALDSPIDWRTFQESALAEARASDRPVFLVIAAPWCPYSQRLLHWLGQSEAAIALLNAAYVPVLVDAESRPDVQAAYNGGGWPSIAVLEPGGEPIWRGTHIPRAEIEGFLASMAALSCERRVQPGERPGARRRQRQSTMAAGTTELAAALLEQTLRCYDESSQGFALQDDLGGPRFPHLDAIALLIEAGAGGDAASAGIARAALGRVLEELWDGAEGGLRRYAAAPDWSDVHGEKLLADNASLLEMLCRAVDDLAADEFREPARAVLAFCNTRLCEGGPGYFTSIRPAHDDVPDGWPVPTVDTSLVVDANARMVSALFAAARVLSDEGARARAIALVEQLWERAVRADGRVVHRLAGGVAIAPGLAADYGRLGVAMLDAYDATSDGRFRDRAERIFAVARRLPERAHGVCLDAEIDGGLDAEADDEVADGRRLPVETMAGNAIIAEFAVRLDAVCGDARQLVVAADALDAFAATAPRQGVLSAGYALALARYRAVVDASVGGALAGTAAGTVRGSVGPAGRSGLGGSG